MFSIDKSNKPKRIQLFLAKPDKTIIAKLKDTNNKNHNIKFQEINDLSFSIPYKIDINHKLQENPHLKKVKQRYLIKTVIGQDVEWYVITSVRKTMSNSDYMHIECMALPYELTFQRMIGYTATSYNCTKVTTDNLSNTRWGIGYINPAFDQMYRQFDVTSQTKLEFQYEIAEKFGGIVQFDTVNRKVNIFTEDEVSKYKGLWIKYGKYLKSIEEDIKIEDVCTRLYITGSDGKTINSINPTGQSYIDDFSYFLYPFERDANNNVISHSDFMEDNLCFAILNHNELIEKNKSTFSNLLKSKATLQGQLISEKDILSQLAAELNIILDNIQVEQEIGNSTYELIIQRNSKQLDIARQKTQISSIESQIDQVNNDILSLQNLLKEENNFTPEQLESLKDFIKVEEWENDNILEVEDLYSEGLKKLKEINSPPINLNVGIVNFLEIVEAQHDWNRLNIGDIIKIRHDKLDIVVQTKITEISFDYESSSVNITLSNTKRIKDNATMFANVRSVAQKTSRDFNIKKMEYDKVAFNFNSRNNRLTEIPTNPTLSSDGSTITHLENDDGSVDLYFKWSFPDFKVTKSNNDNIDGFILYLYSSTINDSYVFGSILANELMTTLTAEKRNYTFPSLPANRYYTIGIRSYRSVDTDISSSGVLFSEIIKSTFVNDDPYLPRTRVYINGDLDGKLNGSTRISSYSEPLVPMEGDIWDDLTENMVKQYDGYQWVPTNAANSDTVGGKSAADFVEINQIGTSNGLATLDSEGYIPLSQLQHVTNQIPNIQFGSYIGDGTLERIISLNFKPTLVRVYTTNSEDVSIYINSLLGGYKLEQNLTSFMLQGDSITIDIESLQYGHLNEVGFVTGNTTDYFGNKLNVKYFWEAIKLPESV